MESSGTHYDVLGVRPDATGDEIDDAFRRLAKIVHPDAGGDETMFEVLADSYSVLRDPALRRQYDASLKSPQPSDAVPTGAPGEREDLTSADWAEDIAPTPPYGQHSFLLAYTKEQWEEAASMSRPRAILHTVLPFKVVPKTWPLADPGAGSQQVNGCVGKLLVVAVILPTTWLISWLLSR